MWVKMSELALPKFLRHIIETFVEIWLYVLSQKFLVSLNLTCNFKEAYC